MNDESLRIETGLSCPQTPSAQPRLSGITKKIYNYVSGNGQSPGMLEAETAPAQTSLVDAATAVLSPRISSMASNIASSLFKGKKSMDLEGQQQQPQEQVLPVLVQMDMKHMDTSLSNSGNGGLLRSDSHESLPGFASTLVHSPSVENFLTQTQPPAFPHLSHSLSSSTHSLPHTVNSFESVGDRTTEYNSGRELNRFDEEEALFSASPRLKPESPTLEGKLQSVATIEQNDKDFDYDDGEVIINLRARPTSANGQAAVEPAAKSLPETPVKQTATRPISADLMASPQLVSPKVKVVETTVLVEKMAEVALDRKELAEFDPLINFETPLQPQMAVSDANCLSPSLGKNKSVPQTPQPSLLDTISNEFTTPSSFLKYTERDMQAMRSQLEAEHLNAMEGMRKEMAAQESKYRISEDARRQLKQVVAEFEQTMAKMLESAKQEKERYGILMDKLGDEKNRTLGELKTLETAFKDLRVRHEELKSVNEHLKKNEQLMAQKCETLQKNIQASEQRFTAVKEHAEKKLEEANAEISRVQQANEKEISLLKAKLQKSDLKLKTIEGALEQKQNENKELMAICDDLIKKMENNNSA